MADNVTQVDGRGVFKGSDEQLCNSIDALLDLNAKGAVSHRVPGMAVTLLEAAADRIAATRPAPKADSALVGELRGILAAQKSHCDWTHDKAVAGFMEANGATILAALSDRDVVLEEAVRKAEDNAWQEARELVRGTNADMCRTAERAYQIIHEGMTDAVNNRDLRTLRGRVAFIRARKGGVDE